jgi:hypothetical protein
MNAREKRDAGWRNWLSPLRLTLLSINAVCFGALIVLLILGKPSGPLVVITIATGLSFGAGLTGALVAARKELRSPTDGSTPAREP